MIPMTNVFLAFLLIGSSIATAQPSSENGTISSIQDGPNGKPAWKVSGTWNFINLASNTPTFNALFDMMIFFIFPYEIKTINGISDYGDIFRI